MLPQRREDVPVLGALAYGPVVLPLICLDVDGTLVGRAGEPSPALWAAAERARSRGQRLTLCTARLAGGPTRTWAERLDPLGWHVFHTGAARWRPATGEVRQEPIPDDAVAACQAIAAERGWVLETYSWDDYVVDSDDPLAVAHAALLALPHRRRPVSDLADPIVRVQFVVPADQAAAAVAAAPTGTTASAATSPVMPGAAFVSVTVAGVSKAAGILHVADDLGVARSTVKQRHTLPLMMKFTERLRSDPKIKATLSKELTRRGYSREDIQEFFARPNPFGVASVSYGMPTIKILDPQYQDN